MREEVRHRQIGQVHVGGRLHVLVPADDGADGGVAQDTQAADAGVDDGDGYDGGEGEVARTQATGDVGRQVRGRSHLRENCAF